jgi:hypothetical protein
MMPIIPSEDSIATLHQLHPPPLDLVPPLIFYYQLEHIFIMDKILFAQALAICIQVGFLEWYMNIFRDASY